MVAGHFCTTFLRAISSSYYCFGNFVIQLLSRVHFFETPWTAAYQNSLSLLKAENIPLYIFAVFCLSIHLAIVVQLLSCILLFVTSWTAAHQASLSITNSQSLLKLMSIKSVIPSNYLILCHPLLLLPSSFPSIRIFSNDSALCIR